MATVGRTRMHYDSYEVELVVLSRVGHFDLLHSLIVVITARLALFALKFLNLFQVKQAAFDHELFPPDALI